MKTDPHKELVDIIRADRPIPPPDGFTEKVMEEVRSHKPRRWWRISRFFLRPRSAGMSRALQGIPTQTDCALLFGMAGFFYLMLGMVLSVGLNPLDSGAVLSGWVMVQPRIAFVTAAGFWILAVVLLKRSAMSVRLARVGVYASIGFAVLNGISLHLAFGVRFHMIGLLMILTGGMVGLWLGVMVRRYGKHMQESGGLGSGAVL